MITSFVKSGAVAAALAGGMLFFGAQTRIGSASASAKVPAPTVDGPLAAAPRDETVVFDASQISLGKLLEIFFSVAHDPTQKNRQGPDVGTQYRSAVFYLTDDQRRVTDAYIKQLTDAKTFARPIVTQVAQLRTFYPAEAYHQHYAMLHPDSPYIATYDLPKVAALKERYPALYREDVSSR